MSYLKFYAINTFLTGKVVTDVGSEAGDDLSLWLPDLSTCPNDGNNYYYLGMFATGNYNNPPTPSGPQFVVAAIGDDPANPLLKAPLGFNLTWKCSGNDQASNLGIYSIVAPNGYVGIGCVAVMDFNTPPQLTDFPGLMCVRQDHVQKFLLDYNCIWDDQGSGAPTDVAVWNLPNSNTGYAAVIQGYDNIQAHAYDVIMSGTT